MNTYFITFVSVDSKNNIQHHNTTRIADSLIESTILMWEAEISHVYNNKYDNRKYEITVINVIKLDG